MDDEECPVQHLNFLYFFCHAMYAKKIYIDDTIFSHKM